MTATETTHHSRPPWVWPWLVSTPALVLLVAVFFLVSSGGISGRDALYPRALAIVVAVFAVYAIVRDVMEIRQSRRSAPVSSTESTDLMSEEPESGIEGRRGVGVMFGRVSVFFLVTVASVWLMQIVGFYIASTVMLAGGILVLGVRSPVRVIAYTVGFIATAYLLFGTLLGVPLPRPLWS